MIDTRGFPREGPGDPVIASALATPYVRAKVASALALEYLRSIGVDSEPSD
ncbi:hypothetical protein [Actinoplanes sp. NPDC048796]|uniref:hypothetical protein n=1 Tax=Actinoplanes sp. NPDC048796 TaxID=3155640 RepID=UPI0033D45A84